MSPAPKLSRAEYIHGQLSGIYFNRWTVTMGTDPNSPDMRAWVAEMRTLTMAQIDTGLKACRQDPSEWPPSPGMFKARCLGVPRYARARYEISGKGEQRSPFVRKMWEFVDSYAYRQAPSDKADRMLRDAYDLAVEHVLADGDLPDMPVALIEQQAPAKPVLPDTREERARKLAALLGEEFNPDTAGLPDSHPAMAELRNPSAE